MDGQTQGWTDPQHSHSPPAPPGSLAPRCQAEALRSSSEKLEFYYQELVEKQEVENWAGCCTAASPGTTTPRLHIHPPLLLLYWQQQTPASEKLRLDFLAAFPVLF